MIKLSNETKGSLYSIISGLFYGTVGYFGVSIMQANFSIANMLFWRFAVASLIMVIMLLPKISKLQFNSIVLWQVFIYGALVYSSSSASYFMASKYIGTGLAMVIFFIYPIIVMFGSWLITKHKITRIYYISVTLVIFGMVLLVDKTQISFDIWGIGLAIFSAITYAMYIIASKNQATKIDPLLSTFMLVIGNCLAFLSTSIFTNTFKLPQTFDLWLDILGIGIICTALPILFFLKGIKYIKPEKAAILSVLEPVCVVIIGALFLGEKLTILQTIGVITILSGALIVQFDKMKYKT